MPQEPSALDGRDPGPEAVPSVSGDPLPMVVHPDATGASQPLPDAPPAPPPGQAFARGPR